jgi:hypothetical protein
MRPGRTEAGHLTRGTGVAGSLHRLGAHLVHAAPDLLTRGPCDVNPDHHDAQRIRYWNLSPEEANELDPTATVAAWPAHLPIVLWATRTWPDQLFLWWTLDRLAAAGVATDRLWWAAPALAWPHD